MLRRVSFPTLVIAWVALIVLCMLATFFGGIANAQTVAATLPKSSHPLLSDTMPPGMIGAIQLQRKPELKCFWQAIEVRGPEGVKLNMAEANTFTPDQPLPARVGLMVGPVYRIRLTGLPLEPEAELFPTIEVIDHITPPIDREHRFPIPIEIDESDIRDALAGEMVMRVIYLEDSEIAEPINTANQPQRVLDVSPVEDALRAADELGRPVAILRIGSRVPTTSAGPEWDAFLFGCPPWTSIKPIPTKQQLIDSAKWPAEVKRGNISDRR